MLGLHRRLGWLVAGSGGGSAAAVRGLLTAVASPVAEPGLQERGSRTLERRRAGGAHSRPAAWGVFPDQGLNPGPLHWQMDSLSLSQQRSPLGSILTL